MSRMQCLPSSSDLRRQQSDPFQTPSSASTSATSLLPRMQHGSSTLSFTPVFMDQHSRTSSKGSRSSFYYEDNPYGERKNGSISSHVTAKYSFAPDPRQWGSNLSPDVKEDDDYLHTPDAQAKELGESFTCSKRGIESLGCLSVLIIVIVGLFAGYPIVSHFTSSKLSTLGGFNLGGINASGQVPSIPGNHGLIDQDTPQEAYTKSSWVDGEDLELVFSDEFNQDGRSFYPGDDPYWEAGDMYYWSTNDMEWYDPEAITTINGHLQITMSNKQVHNLSYQSGMMTTWNKFCFTGGYIEVNVSLPGFSDVSGFWPAIWTMGNLGRAGYGASLEGMWPYTYDACDVGTVANQTVNGQPQLATVDGDEGKGGVLSYLPGQRLSRCTCAGESHPGPMHSDGTYVGRSAPEIDVLEAQVTSRTDNDPLRGQVSQSGQWAPFNYAYEWFNTSDNEIIQNTTLSFQNSYTGSVLQQATSVVTETDQNCYTNETGCFSIYGFEYKPGFDDAYITWIANNKVSWTLKQAGMAADSRVEISDRPVPQEPMYIIVNFGMSTNFATVDLEHLPFPTTMLVDYIRVYQKKGQKNIGCDPEDFPTQAYIDTYIEAYTNPNLTTWQQPSELAGYGQSFPKNSFLGEC